MVVGRGSATAGGVARLLAEQHGLECLDSNAVEVDSDVAHLLPRGARGATPPAPSGSSTTERPSSRSPSRPASSPAHAQRCVHHRTHGRHGRRARPARYLDHLHRRAPTRQPACEHCREARRDDRGSSRARRRAAARGRVALPAARVRPLRGDRVLGQGRALRGDAGAGAGGGPIESGTTDEIFAEAVAQGMTTLRQDGLQIAVPGGSRRSTRSGASPAIGCPNRCP